MSRRIGALFTLLGMQLFGAIAFLLVLAALGRWPDVSVGAALSGSAVAVVGSIGAYLSYRALATGPVAVVSPIIASYTALTILLLVAVLGERVDLERGVAILVTFGGVLLVSTDLREARATLGRPLPGARLGFVAMIAFALTGVATAIGVRANDPLAIVLVARVVGFVGALAIVLLMRARLPAAMSAGTIAALAAIGVADTLGVTAFTLGMQTGPAAVVAVAAGAYPALPVLLGIAFLRERLAINQYAGIGVVIAGLVWLGSRAP